MGFKTWFDAQNERSKAARVHAPFNANYGLTNSLNAGRFVSPGLDEAVAGARAEFERGGDQSRPTITRIAAGAIIAGPAGAIVGGMFKKAKGKLYVTVTFPSGNIAVVEGPAKDESKLREFARRINVASAHYAEEPA